MDQPKPAQLSDVEHCQVDYDQQRYCGHPRQHGIWQFPDGELAVMYARAPCPYQEKRDITHGFIDGYKSRSQVILRRSSDNGRTWPAERDVVVYDASRPLAERRAYVSQDPAGRDYIDLSAPESMIYFARTATGPEGDDGYPRLQCIAIRSADRGYTWEDVPLVLEPPPRMDYLLKDGYPLARLPDGSLVGAATASGPGHRPAVWLYGSENDGMTWDCLSLVARDHTGIGSVTYANCLRLPDGRLQCYMVMINGRYHTLCLSESTDCFEWTEPRPIIRYGYGPWAKRWPDGAWGNVLFRSPWPLVLRDGRIVVIYARRQSPAGMGVIVSDDGGRQWSDPAILRDDASGPDIGYPVAVELEDGRIFTAYYYMRDDGNGFDGTRFIAGSFFRV